MDKLTELEAAAQAFNDAHAAQAIHREQAAELNIDLAIAKRGNDAEAVQAAETAIKDHGPAYMVGYKEKRDAALKICQLLDLQPNEIKYSI